MADIDTDGVAASIIDTLTAEDEGAGSDTAATGDAPAEGGEESDSGKDVDTDAQTKIEQALEADEAKAADDKSVDTEAKDEAGKQTDPKSTTAAQPIEPPASWKAEAKERFKTLPPETQKDIVDRESEREAHFTRTQQETATFKREVETERKTVQSERESFSNHIKSHQEQVTALFGLLRKTNPIIAAGDQMDWDSEFAKDPGTAATKQTLYQRELNKLAGVAAQEKEAVSAAQAEHRKGESSRAEESFKRAVATIQEHPELGPIWKDEGKRVEFQNKVSKFLEGQGLAPEERVMKDARALIIAKMAMERSEQTVPYAEALDKAQKYDKLMAEQTKIAAAKKPPAPQKVLKPAAADEADVSDENKALIARAAKAGNIRDQADLLARALR